MKTAVIDYEAGNLASVVQGLRQAGLNPFVTRDPGEILKAQAVILPGVGAFARGMCNLKGLGLLPVLQEVKEEGIPLLGICLGMQMLFESSEEHGFNRGLGFLPGQVSRFPAGLKIPHMGWNNLSVKKNHPILRGIADQDYFYFVHSYFVNSCRREDVAASANYGVEFPAVVCFNNIMGIQFHPEKSSSKGIEILRNFGELVEKCK